MMEHAVRMGPWRSSLGVATLPEARHAQAHAPVVLFVNAGLLHHSGPHRMHVHMARRLAESGITSLRFDLSGIGDSGLRQDRMGRQESIVQETRDAMDFMAGSYGAKTFVLFGLCAGADQAVRTALEDTRVIGTVLVDGYAYRTTGHVLHHYADRFLRPRSWWNVLSLRHPGYARLVSRLRGATGDSMNETPKRPVGPRLGVYLKPTREEAEKRLGALVERGCEVLAAYTPSAHFNRPAQFAEMYPALAGSKHVRVAFFDHANHMFTLLANQEALVARVESWMDEVILTASANKALMTHSRPA